MKIVYTGLESAGKSLLLASKALDLVRRNRNWDRKYGFRRLIYSNLFFSPAFYENNKDYIRYWYDIRELLALTGVDILWDEISSDFSALKKEPLPKKVNRWLRQGAKQGIHIYATAQEFHDIHLDFRRRVFRAEEVVKLIGSSRGGACMPPVRHIWGLCMTRDLKIRPYNEINPEYTSIIPSFFLITRELCDIFDTHQLIQESKEVPLEHIERFCVNPKCRYFTHPRIDHR